MLNYKNQNFGKWGSDVTGQFMDIVSIENISEMATLNIRQCKPRTRTKWNSCKSDDMPQKHLKMNKIVIQQIF